MRFGLTEEELQLLEKTLFEPLRNAGAEVWIFGSRARGDHKKFSDIDVLFELPKSKVLPSGLLSKIKEELDQGNLPYKVDIVERQNLANSYCDQVDRDKIILKTKP